MSTCGVQKTCKMADILHTIFSVFHIFLGKPVKDLMTKVAPCFLPLFLTINSVNENFKEVLQHQTKMGNKLSMASYQQLKTWASVAWSPQVRAITKRIIYPYNILVELQRHILMPYIVCYYQTIRQQYVYFYRSTRPLCLQKWCYGSCYRN